MLKKIFTCLLLIGIFTSGCGEKKSSQSDLDRIIENNKIIVGVKTDTKPFGYLDKNGKHAGFDVDLAYLLADSILGSSGEVEFVPVNSSDRIMKLNSNKVDMVIATMTINHNRKYVIDFSIPYYTAGQAIMVDSKSSISSLGELADKKVIVVFGSTSEQDLRAQLPTLQILGYRTYEEAYQALANNLGDAIIADDTILLDYVLTHDDVKLLKQRYSQEPYAIGFRKTPQSQSLQQKVNVNLKTLNQTGTLDRLREKHQIK